MTKARYTGKWNVLKKVGKKRIFSVRIADRAAGSRNFTGTEILTVRKVGRTVESENLSITKSVRGVHDRFENQITSIHLGMHLDILRITFPRIWDSIDASFLSAIYERLFV